ncbi:MULTISPECIES: HepT-like ribonuclease domain-containing protein [Clostridium]
MKEIRKFRNRLAHRYKVLLDEELIKNLKENIICIEELEQAIKELVN